MAFVHSPKIVTDGLVLALDAGNVKSYPGSGTTWLDKSGFGNNGTLINGPTFNSGNGGSIVFDGVDDYITLGDILDAGSGDYTFQTWSRSTFTNSVNKMIMDKRDGINRILLYSTSITGYVIAGIGDGSQIFIAIDDVNHRDGVWRNHVFTVSRSSNLLKLYRNGTNISSTDITGLGTQNNSVDLVLGAGYQFNSTSLDSSYYWQGNIAMTQVYNRALTPPEVLQNYNATKGRFGL
jgi:hypothetical protein